MWQAEEGQHHAGPDKQHAAHPHAVSHLAQRHRILVHEHREHGLISVLNKVLMVSTRC